MFTVTVLLVFAAFALAVVSSSGRVPLWTSVVLLCVVELLQSWPR
jgi:hypothetical protein